ncbi:hypothetical protein CQA53_11065 [Helicobacter didelphidarum]|uniref:Uncharacterized protein n=1 Tax=Helicobacter didelphidarum TaxID=2040648 RepID=A0A3D8I4K1_9HELI|nr:hypothetical protein [Helicobacter didelphidarum]RDU60083.1 hypothetical protein CQA53_11065 [Helicobacter didelphidarum]
MKKILVLIILGLSVYADGEEYASKTCKEMVFLKSETPPLTNNEVILKLKRFGVSYLLGLDTSRVYRENGVHDQFFWHTEALCHRMPRLDDALDELKSSIRKLRDEKAKQYQPNLIREIGSISVWNVDKALHFYDLPEYQAEVERIVKKYCKECK